MTAGFSDLIACNLDIIGIDDFNAGTADMVNSVSANDTPFCWGCGGKTAAGDTVSGPGTVDNIIFIYIIRTAPDCNSGGAGTV